MPQRPTDLRLVLDLAISGKSFGDSRILGPVRLTLRAGQRYAITGPSGIGKSTLMRIIAGLEDADGGVVTRPERIAMVFQCPTLLAWRSALDNIVLTTGVAPDIARMAMASVGLEGKENLFPGQLSFGQQRRLSLARALSSRPELLLMDEPFGSLDPATADRMIELTREKLDEAGLATVMVTHSRSEADRLAERTLRLEGVPAVFQV